MALGRQPLHAVLQTGLASVSQLFWHACGVSTLDCLWGWNLGAPIIIRKSINNNIRSAAYLHAIEAILIVMPACMNIKPQLSLSALVYHAVIFSFQG